jgi:hypothetical protein
MNDEQLIVASGDEAGAVSRLPPEETTLEEDTVYPAGKYDWGSSTVSSCVPVSCPVAAASGDCDSDGAGEEEGEAAAEADAGAEADGV